MKAFKAVKKYGAQVGAAVGTGLLTVQAHAASALDAEQLTAYQTTFADTVDDAKAYLIGLVFILGIAMFAVNMTKKVVGKAGGR